MEIHNSFSVMGRLVSDVQLTKNGTARFSLSVETDTGTGVIQCSAKDYFGELMRSLKKGRAVYVEGVLSFVQQPTETLFILKCRVAMPFSPIEPPPAVGDVIDRSAGFCLGDDDVPF